jgi:tetratricopeptide (TPR) repeat protein
VAAALAAIVALGGGGVWLSSWLRSTETLADARATFERGVREFELRRYDDARRDFEEAYRLHGDAALLLDAAQGYRKGGRNEDALYFYRLYLKRDPETPSRAIVEEQIRRLEKIVPGP